MAAVAVSRASMRHWPVQFLIDFLLGEAVLDSLSIFFGSTNERRFSNIQRPALNENLAGGGARTHTALRPLDFESSASANSATPAFSLKPNYTMEQCIFIHFHSTLIVAINSEK